MNNNNFTFKGFGFPVIINNVKIISREGETYPNIDYSEISRKVLLNLAKTDSVLTGNQVKFIRKQLGLSLEAFGKIFKISHAAVVKWESKKDTATGMLFSNEVLLKMYVLNHLKEEESFIQCFSSILQNNLSDCNPEIQIK